VIFKFVVIHAANNWSYIDMEENIGPHDAILKVHYFVYWVWNNRLTCFNAILNIIAAPRFPVCLKRCDYIQVSTKLF